MKFQRSAPRVLIFSVVVVVIGMAVLSNRLFSGLTSAVEQTSSSLYVPCGATISRQPRTAPWNGPS